MYASIVSGILDVIQFAIAKTVESMVHFALYAVMDTALDPDLSLSGFLGNANTGAGPYSKTFGLGLILLAVFLTASIIGAMVRGEISQAIRSVALDLPIAIFLMTFTLAFAGQMVKISNQISSYFLNGVDVQLGAFASGMSQWLGGATGTTSAGVGASNGGGFFLVLIIGLLTILSAMLLWLVLLVRLAFLYTIVLMMPFIFAALVWPMMRPAVKKGIEALLGFVFLKPIMALIMAVGGGALGSIAGIDTADSDKPQYIAFCAESSGSRRVCPAGVHNDIVKKTTLQRVFPVVDGAPVAGNEVEEFLSTRNARFTNDAKLNLEYKYMFSVTGRLKNNDNGYFKGKSCVAGGSVPKNRVYCDLANFLPSKDEPVIEVDGIIFRLRGPSNSRTVELIGKTGEFLNPAESQACWRLVPVDLEIARLIPDTSCDPDNPTTSGGIDGGITSDDAANALTVALDSGRMTRIVYGISGGNRQLTGAGSQSCPASDTTTCVPGAPVDPETRSTNVGNPIVTQKLFSFFGCDNLGQPLVGTASGPVGDVVSNGCLTTTKGDDPYSVYVRNMGGEAVLMAYGSKLGVVLAESSGGADFGAVLVGAVLMLMAAFAPFFLIRLFPLLEMSALEAAAAKPWSRFGALTMNSGAALNAPETGRKLGQQLHLIKKPTPPTPPAQPPPPNIPPQPAPGGGSPSGGGPDAPSGMGGGSGSGGGSPSGRGPDAPSGMGGGSGGPGGTPGGGGSGGTISPATAPVPSPDPSDGPSGSVGSQGNGTTYFPDWTGPGSTIPTRPGSTPSVTPTASRTKKSASPTATATATPAKTTATKTVRLKGVIGPNGQVRASKGSAASLLQSKSSNN